MKGNVIGFDPDSNTGAISGHDGKRYDFATVDWHSHNRPMHGDLVDFLAEGSHAAQIYPIEPEYVAPGFAQFYFSAEGRISRSQYWLRFFVPVLVITVVLSILAGAAKALGNDALGEAFDALYLVFYLLTLWPGIAVLVKRIHDRDKSGWLVALPYGLMALAVLAAVASAATGSDTAARIVVAVLVLAFFATMIWFFVEFGCLRGTIGANRYGPDPLAGR